MPQSIPAPVLPMQWKTLDNKTLNSPREILRELSYEDFEFPIKGGWGYSQDECVIIDRNDPIVDKSMPFDGISLEHKYIASRSVLELEDHQPVTQEYWDINWHIKLQALHKIQGRMFEEITVKVTAYHPKDLTTLKQFRDKKNNFENDPENLQIYLKMKESLLSTYETKFWFDITSFFGK